MSQSWHSRLEPWAVQPTIKIHDFPVALGIQGIFGTPPLRYIHNHPTRLVGLYIGLCLLLRSKVINLIFALVFTQAAFRYDRSFKSHNLSNTVHQTTVGTPILIPTLLLYVFTIILQLGPVAHAPIRQRSETSHGCPPVPRYPSDLQYG
jgi:hypothetical protein